jgi:predicted nucleic acid-binding protein
MTSSSSPAAAAVLDTMILVYSSLLGHPAGSACKQFLRMHTGWVTSPLVLFEAKSVLTKVYGVDAADATQRLMQIAGGPVTLIDLTPADVTVAFQLADRLALDHTDAALLLLAQNRAAKFLATDDQRLAAICSQFGVTPLSPLDATLRQAVSAWETSHLPPKGLQRVLRQVYVWLNQSHPQAAQGFWTQTVAGSRLP